VNESEIATATGNGLIDGPLTTDGNEIEREEVGGARPTTRMRLRASDAEKKMGEMSVGDGVDCIAPALSLPRRRRRLPFRQRRPAGTTASNAIRCLA